MTGWIYNKEDESAQCNYCNRKWSLEKLLLNEKSSQNADNKTEGFSKDPISQHQRWCAWRREFVGWESQLEQLKLMRNFQSNPKRTRLDSSDYVYFYRCFY